MYAFKTVVVKRSYSLISGHTSEETLTSTPDKLSSIYCFKIFSLSELAYECKKPIPILSKFSLLILDQGYQYLRLSHLTISI